MTRGNQRDIDRARANNRHASDRSDKRTEGDPRKKMEDQARALQEKVAKKRAAAEAAAAAGGSTGGSADSGGGSLKKK